MDKFRTIRQQVTCRQVLEDYGISVNKYGRCPCPIHQGKDPNFRVYDDGYYCFVCHASGDVTSLVATLEGLNQSEAANTLIERYGLCIDPLSVEDAETAQRKRYLAVKATLRCLYDLGTRLYDRAAHTGDGEGLTGADELLKRVETEMQRL